MRNDPLAQPRINAGEVLALPVVAPALRLGSSSSDCIWVYGRRTSISPMGAPNDLIGATALSPSPGSPL